MDKKELKVSIIIATYNSEQHLEQTLESVLKQTYKNIELIVVDGLSTDNTITILKKYLNKLTFISEQDLGISDAFNKGIRLSTGQFIYFLGSDDFLLSPYVIADMMENVDDHDMLLCGKIKRVSLNGQEVLWTAPKSMAFHKRSLLFKMALPHQGLFMNKKYFTEYGMFDVFNKYAMDYELLLRSFKNFPEVIMKDIYVAAWREGGIGADATEWVLEEYNKIKVKNKVAPVFLLNLIHKYIRFKYLVKKVIKWIRKK